MKKVVAHLSQVPRNCPLVRPKPKGQSLGNCPLMSCPSMHSIIITPSSSQLFLVNNNISKLNRVRDRVLVNGKERGMQQDRAMAHARDRLNWMSAARPKTKRNDCFALHADEKCVAAGWQNVTLRHPEPGKSTT